MDYVLNKFERSKHKTSEFRDVKLEKIFAGCILKYPDIFRKVVASFNADALTSDKVRWIYKRAVELYRQEGVILDKEAFQHLLEVDRKRKNTYNDIWTSIQNLSKGKKQSEGIGVLRKHLIRFFNINLYECINFL